MIMGKIFHFRFWTHRNIKSLELTKKYCPDSPFIFMSTNKVYGDNPNKLKIFEKNRFELNFSDKYYNGIDENFSIDNCTHSFWCF